MHTCRIVMQEYTIDSDWSVTMEAIMALPREHYVRVGPINTRYWVQGEGMPVILVHGLGGSATGWLLSFDSISTQHRVYALDLIGHGKTDTPNLSQFQFQDLVEFLCEFISILGIESAHLVGHSMGGAITLQFAIQYPERARKLVLVDSGGLGKEVGFLLRLASVPVLGDLVTSWTYTSDVNKFGKNLRSSSAHPDFITDELIQNIFAVEQSSAQYKSTLKILRMCIDTRGQKQKLYEPILHQLSSLTNPTLVIWGQQDELLPLKHGELACRQIPSARLEIIDPCGHTPMFDQPKIFNRLVLEFLKN